MEQDLVNWLFTAVGFMFGWLMTILWNAIKDLKNDVKQIERDLPEIYVRRDDFKEAVSELKNDMRELRQDMKDGFRKIDNTLGLIIKHHREE
jgi:uncharacterized coiled-coil DUF342 family protein